MLGEDAGLDRPESGVVRGGHERVQQRTADPSPLRGRSRRRPSARSRRGTPHALRRGMPRPSPRPRLRRRPPAVAHPLCLRRRAAQVGVADSKVALPAAMPSAKMRSTERPVGRGHPTDGDRGAAVTSRAAARRGEIRGAHPGRGQGELHLRGGCGIAVEPRDDRPHLLVPGGEEESVRDRSSSCRRGRTRLQAASARRSRAARRCRSCARWGSIRGARRLGASTMSSSSRRTSRSMSRFGPESGRVHDHVRVELDEFARAGCDDARAGVAA